MKNLLRQCVFAQAALLLVSISLVATAHSHPASIDRIGQHELLYLKAQLHNYPYELVLAVYENSKTKRAFSRTSNRKSKVLVLPHDITSRYRMRSTCASTAEVNADIVIKYLMDLEAEFGSIESVLNEFYRSVSRSTKRFEYDRNGNSRFTNRVLSDFIKYQNDASLQAKIQNFKSELKVDFAEMQSCSEEKPFVARQARSHDHLSVREERIKLIRDWESVYDR